eukprot:356977_1
MQWFHTTIIYFRKTNVCTHCNKSNSSKECKTSTSTNTDVDSTSMSTGEFYYPILLTLDECGEGIGIYLNHPHEIHQQYVRDCCVYSEFHGQRDDLSVQQTQNVLKGMNWQSSVFDLPLLIDTEQWKSQFVKILNYDPKQQHQMNRMYSYLWCFETLIRLNPELLKIQILQTKHLESLFTAEFLGAHFKDIFWMYSWISFCLNNELPCLMLISVSRNVFAQKSKKQKINKLGLKPRCFPRKVLSGWLENQERLNEQNTRVLKALRWKFDTKKYLTERNVYPSDLL